MNIKDRGQGLGVRGQSQTVAARLALLKATARVAATYLVLCAFFGTSPLSAESKNISTLSFKATTKEITGIENLGIKKSFGTPSGRTEILTWSLEPEKETSRHKLFGYDQIIIKNLSARTKPGEPSLPVKNWTVTLPLNAEVNGVEVTDIEYSEIENHLKILPTPRPRKFSSRSGNLSHNENNMWETSPDVDSGTGSVAPRGRSYVVANPEIYKKENFFPGNLASYEIGRDNENTYVFIRFYPLQYIPAKGKAILITSAKIILYYQ